MSIGHLLNQIMNVYTISDTQTDTGGYEETETLKYENVPCAIEVASGNERELLGRPGVVVSHILYADVDGRVFIAKDRIKIGTDVYDIQVPENIQERDHHFEIGVLSRT